MADKKFRIRIRMYRQGLGDCFLLTTLGETPHHILIDCGVLKGSPNAQDRIRDVVKDIGSVTNNHLDLLVATHEHWDHLSGFSDQQAQDLFNQITIDQIWMGWTEKSGDPQADALHEKFDKQKQALHLALDSTAMSEEKRMVEPLLRFFGYDGGLMPFAFAQSTRDALDYLKHRSSADISCCEPGEIRRLGRNSGLRFFILGPPRDPKLLKKDLPKAGSKESYEFAAAELLSGFFMNQEAANGLRDLYPFDPSFRVTDPAAGRVALAKLLTEVKYDSPQAAWRKLDSKMLGLATELALQMDSDTNNTSLALAIEVEETGDVLLFPGDAQIGNWQSWHGVKWKGEPELTMTNLYARTVFYKVGHHGSHNATLREGGLELMNNPNLVAMIPTDEVVAAKQGPKGWRMPAHGLNEVLREKTRGRLLRLDLGFDHDSISPPPGLTSGAWERFRDAVKEEELFIEYVL